jgi:CheY-like chemotaxis protein
MTERARILIVDDDVSQSQTLSLILRHKGYVVETANDGLEAIRKVEAAPFDITFIDIKMPLMNGVETYRRIREVCPDLLVTMMTAYALEDLVQQGLEEGVRGILYKPLDIELMLSTIEEAAKIREGTANAGG